MSQTAAATAAHQSRDAGVLVLGRLLATLSDALLPLVIVRLLGKAEVGVLTSVLLVYTTVALVLATGFPTALMYYLPGRAAPERRAVATLVARTLLGFGAVASLLIAGSGWLPAASGTSQAALVQGGLGHLFLLSVFPLGDLPARMLPNLLVIEGRSDLAARYAVAKSVANALFVLVPASAGAGVSTVLLCYSAFGLLQGATLAYALRTLYAGAARTRSPIALAEVARFAVPLGMTDIVAMLSGRLDRLLISMAFPVAAFAEYQAGAFQIPVLTTVAYTVGTVYTPRLTELLREGKAREAIAIWRTSIEKVSLLVVPLSLVFVVAAEELVELLFTEQYARAAPVFRCYALLTMGRVASFGTVIVAAGQPRFILSSAAWSLLATGALVVPGWWLFGFVGPALGTAVAFVPTVAIYCLYIARATGVPARDVFPLVPYSKVLGLALVAAVPAYACKRYLVLPAPAMLAVVTGSCLSAFTLLGLWTGQLVRSDFRYFASLLRGGRGA